MYKKSFDRMNFWTRDWPIIQAKKFTKQLKITGFLQCLFSSRCLGMNFDNCCTNELEIRIYTHFKIFDTKFTNSKMFINNVH